MKNWKKFPRVIFLALLIVLLAGFSAPVVTNQPASAAPMRQAATNVVISEFRTTATDEFIELYNPTNSTISLSGLKLRRSSSCGGTLNDIYVFPSGINLLPGQYYLVAGLNYSGTIFDIHLTTNMSISDTGGVAITDSINTPIDQVGMCVGTTYKEGTPLEDITTTTGLSYERYLGSMLDSCQDATNNSIDFQPINPSNPQNSSTPPRLCGGNADLSLTQSVDNPTQTVLNNVTFTITVSNAGTGDARSVEVKDVLPIGLTYVSSSVTLGSYNSGTGIWLVGTLPNSSNAILTIVATVATGGVKTNSAEVWKSYDQDPNSTPGNGGVIENDYATATVTPPSLGSADLSVTKTVNNSTPNVNDSVVFTITVRNAGPDTATSVIINDDLPTGLNYVSDTGGGTYNISTGEWIISSLASGLSSTLKITTKVNTTGAKTNTASVLSLGQTDSNASNDSANVTVTPSGGISNLTLTQTYAKASPAIPGYVELTITVSNVAGAGLYNATNVIVKDKLPTGLTYVSDDSGGAYNKDTYMWSAGAISNGASKSLKIKVKVDPTGTMTNWAEVWSADQTPSDLRVYGNNSTTEDDDASVTVQSADLSITKSMDNVTPSVGQDVVFTIRVSNAGPDNATNVQVKDVLPANFSYLSDDSGGNYNSSTTGTNAGVWAAGTINSGSSKTLKITATMVTGSISVNWAQVWKSDQIDIDSVPGNNSTNTDDDASAPAADLRVEQTVSTTTTPLNSDFTFTITVTNDGTVGTTGVEVKDKLPSGLTYVWAVPSIGTYDSSTGIWNVGTLATGSSASATLTITAKMTSSGVYTNWAEVWKSDLPDPDSTPGNSSRFEDDDYSKTVSFSAIIINEVAWAGTTASPNDEWIELYNPSSTSINIDGWTLKSASGSLNVVLNSTSGIIKSGEYYLLEREDELTVSDITADQLYPGLTLNMLSDTGEVLTLYDSSLKVIDTANQEGSSSSANPWPKGAIDSNLGSMERQRTSTESDASWVTNRGNPRNGLNANNGLIYGTPRKANSAGLSPNPTPTPVVPIFTVVPRVGRPILNEFLPRPGFDWNQDGKVNVFDEFIEIKNIGNADSSLSGWTLDDEAGKGSNPYPLPAVTLKIGERMRFYGLQTNILLSDGGDTVRLIDPNGKIYDAYTYAIAKVEDRSVCRLPDGNGSWYEDCIPTPNFTNSREGNVPSMPGGEVFESPVCDLPDTLPTDFLFAECRGYGANIWYSFFWDQFGWQGDQYVPANMSKWESFVE